MVENAEKKRVEQEQDELQKQQQDQVEPEEVDDEDTSQDEDDNKDQDEGGKTPLIQRIKIGALKVLKILIKWVIKPLAIAIVVFASAISLIVNLGGPSDADKSSEEPTTDPGEDDIPEEEFDDSDQDGEDQVE